MQKCTESNLDILHIFALRSAKKGMTKGMANCAKHRTLQKKVFIDPLELQRFKTISIPQKNMRKGELSFFCRSWHRSCGNYRRN